jgi:hypothetical protein
MKKKNDELIEDLDDESKGGWEGAPLGECAYLYNKTQKPIGADRLTPAEAAIRLGIEERVLYALWKAEKGPEHVFVGNDVAFRLRDLEEYAKKIVGNLPKIFASVPMPHEVPYWKLELEPLDELRVLFQAYKNGAKPNGIHAYLKNLQCFTHEALRDQPRKGRFEKFSACCNEVMETTTTLSKSSRSLYARALAICDRDQLPFSLFANHGNVKTFVNTYEEMSPVAARKRLRKSLGTDLESF